MTDVEGESQSGLAGSLVAGWVVAVVAGGGCALSKVSSLLLAGSTSSLKCFKKSTPIIGKLTAANKKFQENRQQPNST
jgi:hypothetical protein